MNDQEKINSNPYWDHRFETDWEGAGGREQSRFFARVAIEAMPQWLVHEVRRNKLSVCDWGCAQGDGTAALAQMLSWDVTGVDFSGPAIDRARQQYANVKYSHENFLELPDRPKFDVVFSSNTLEHFEDPWSVFDKIANYASRFIVLLLPYREFERHPEHDVTFDTVNIPLAPTGDWVLAHHAVVNTATMEPTYWRGYQVLLIYARPPQLAAQSIMLVDVAHAEADASSNVVKIQDQQAIAEAAAAEEATALKQELAQTRSDLESQKAHLADIEGTVQQNSERLDSLDSRDSQPAAQSAVPGDFARGDAGASNEAAKSRELMAAADAASESVAFLKQELAQARSDLEGQKSRVADVEAESRRNAERVHFLEYRERTLMDEVSTMVGSRSWRLTAPLRAVRRVPGWLRRRQQDVKYAYSHGGLSNVAARSLAYIPRHMKRAALASAPVVSASKPLVLRGPREKRLLPDVFVFGIIDWHFRIQRPQHLAREFARAGHRVYYFTNHFEDSKELGFTVERLDESLPLYQVKLKVEGAPAIYFAAPTDQAIAQMLDGMTDFRDWSGTDRCVTLVQHAYWFELAKHQQSQCLAYDCMDHHEGFGNVPQELLDLEEHTMKRADLLVATSGWLEEHAHKYNRNVAVVRNAGQYSHFCDAPEERYTDPRGRKIIGYYGAIAEWFDADLVARVAQAFPDALVLLVGSDTANVGARLREFSNVEMTGEVPYARLPYYLYAFDVCIMPFKVIPLTLATNPVKVYEYLASGRPVVSVDLPEMAQFQDLVDVADTHDGFIENVRRTLAALPDSADTIARRKSFAASQTWAHRVHDFREAIQALPRPRVSAIVLTYNNLGLTKDCLDSLEKHSDDVDLEIVIVDNASSDGSPEFLSSWAASRSNVKLILNSDNRGFAGGNNQGLEAASGDYLVILNNDTVVTRGWAWRMVNHLRDVPEMGLVGPLTNNIGNEARVETQYTTLDDLHVEAEQITERNLGTWFEIRTAAFFCAMLPRSTYERCGPISEDYGLGFFEDDDYCRRVQAAGLIVACAEDAFVHHHLSASFDKLGAERKRALFEKNRAIYEAKWGKWTPHQYRLKNTADKKA
ncbi:glycosyltransferase [Burkholderia sp. Ac-20345]|uniref:glycosyltransferase n=1 Tax=Burkholderia sp. Ac-20345 TaxID=2703891 RepID=UPI00197C277F|nr:glycosyltransferase [Burkholderia sp. Ac-20345]MBN3782839.1 glycosyltransferase [Burkholderia sp. Ac-20345]